MILIFTVASFAGTIELNSIQGIVVDYETNEPVPGAVIKFVEVNRYTTTNHEGRFTMECKGNHDKVTLDVSHLAYRETSLQINVDSAKSENIIVYLIPKSIEINPVLVTDYKAYSKFDDLQELGNVLKGKELERELGLTLASTLKNETGLSIRSMGPAPARPVIRGLGADRVMISEDGIKTIDLSATSPDHAVTIDPFNLSRIEVLRGPRVLTKTSTSIGGVVNVVRNEIPVEQHDHFIGNIGAYGETVNGGYLSSVVMEAPVDNTTFRAEFSSRNSFNLNTPEGKLQNSYSENINYSLGGSYFFPFGYAGISYRDFQLDYGVPGGFIGAHPKGVDITMYRRQMNIRSKLRINTSVINEIDVSLSRVLYRHKEVEASGAIGSEFKIISYLGHVNAYLKDLYGLSNGTLGISFEHRDFDIGGFVFTTPAKSLNTSLHYYQPYSVKDFNFEFAARINYDRIEPSRKFYDPKIGLIRHREFMTYSLSLSALYEISEIVYAGFNLSKSSRVPTIEELYSRGPHLAAYSYEVGNPDLEDESGFGFEAFVYHKFRDLYWNFNFFRNDLSYYIVPRNTGEINYQTFLPVYKTEGVRALLYGIEFQIDWDVVNHLKISNNVSFTRGNFKGSENSLPQIPPMKGKIEFQYLTESLSLGLNAEWAGVQNNVDQFEDPTDSYFILNGFSQYSFISEHLIHNFVFNVDNIFDTVYRNHLSRVKVILPEAGRNFRFTYKLFFTF
ncbi:MAG: TonB-dependent receptor [Melioribacteraceae bacterium]|nr:TonB-dependent receptor [Melioribacteraceae bacterium]